MSRFTDEQIAKLPKWAQSMVQGMTQELDKAVETRDRALNPEGAKDSPVTMQVYDGSVSSHFREIPLSPTGRVRFSTPDGLKVEVSLRKLSDEMVVEVMEISSRRQMVMMPQVSNVIYLKGVDR